MEGVDKDSMVKQASHIWSMLDDMAANNPQAYKKFIDQKMKERDEYFSPPEPHMCVQTYIQGPNAKKIYINFFSWHRIPEPKSDTAPVSVVGGKIQEFKEKTGVSATATIAMNPQPLKDCEQVTSQMENTQTIIHLALAFVEKQNNISLSRTYCIFGKNDLYRGNLTDLKQGLVALFKKQDEAVEDIEEQFSPAALGTKDSLLNQMSNIVIDKDKSKKIKDVKPNIKIIPDEKVAKKGMIEEISTDKVQLSTPKYDVNIIEAPEAGGEKNVVVKIHLPLVKSVDECELDISEDDLKLFVGDKYELHVPLPEPIVEDDANAKFSKKLCALTIRMPVR
ncbi:hypothetical protein ScPMuIL_002658 [Solemya velum]